MSDYINNDVEMEWDSSIQNDNDFVLLPEGDYDFEVLSFERKRFGGSAKMSPCPQAAVKIKLLDNKDPGKGSATVVHNLYLNRKCEGLLCAFFTAIGDRKHGEQLKMNWPGIIGKKGRCKVSVREWKDSNGETRQSNEIVRFFEPEIKASSGWKAGEF